MMWMFLYDLVLGAGVSVGLRFLLKWLTGKTQAAAQSLFWGIIFWLSAVIDTSPLLIGSSDDPFEAPLLVGVKGRSLNISQSKKVKVVKIASKGDVFRSEGAVLKGMGLVGRTSGGAEHGSESGNKWTLPYIFQYVYSLRRVFIFEVFFVPIYSFAWDATRLSKLDVLVATIYHHASALAGWCPPQACP